MNLTPSQKRIIEEFKKGNTSVSAIARNLRENKSSIFYQIKDLEKQGIVQNVIENNQSKYIFANAQKLKDIIEQSKQELENLLLSLPKKQTFTVVFADGYNLPSDLHEQLSKSFKVKIFESSPLQLSTELFLLRAQEADVVVIFSPVKLSRKILLQCKNLKYIISATTAREQIDEKACKELKINIFELNTHKYYEKYTRQEFLISALFSMLRPLKQAGMDVKIGKFDYRSHKAFELYSKKIGIVGIRREGADIVPVLRAFGAEIYIYNDSDYIANAYDFGVGKFYSLKELFKICEIIIFAEEFEALDISPYLNTNMACKYLVIASSKIKYSLDKMREIIIQKTLKGLFIDYIPNIFNEFNDFAASEFRKIYNFPNVTITPEIGFYTEENMQRSFKKVFKILQEIATTHKLS